MIIQSSYDDVELAQVPLHAFVLDGAAARAAQPALIDGATGVVLSYRELAESVRKAAAGLVAHGPRAEYHALPASSPLGPSSSVRLQSSIGQRVLPGPAVAIAMIGEVAVL